jgi:hypothetical protein
MLQIARRLAVASAVSAVLIQASAAEVSLETRDDLARSSFTLDFGDGSPRSAVITTSEIDLRIDPDTGAAFFAYYHQVAEPLLLPIPVEPFFVSTGPMIIETVPGSSSGTFNPADGTFSTTEDYVIYFEGDLSMLGFESPVVFEGASAKDPGGASSQGQLTNVAGDYESGDVALNWSGTFELSFPSGPVPFEYRCAVNATFNLFEGCASAGCDDVDMNRDCAVDLGDLTRLLQNFGARGPLVARRSGDVDGDADVDIADLGEMLSAFFAECN